MSRIVPPIGARLVAALFAALLLLSACDSAEERAEAHFQAGLAHLEAGDVERALVEFRNVFNLNGQHKEARLTYARLERERGNVPVAYGQYLRLVEQYPDNLEGHRNLAEMALEMGNWEDVRRHGTLAGDLAPDDIEIKSINNMLAYTDAIRDGNFAGVDLTVHTAREMIKSNPELMTARQIVIDHLIRDEDWPGVLQETEVAIDTDPMEETLYGIRLRALQELDMPAEIEALLRQMAVTFPDDEGVEQLLVQHYIDRGNLDAAEQMLRAEVDPQAEDHMPTQRLIAFLNDNRGSAAAIAELDAITAEDGPNTFHFRTVRAALKFRSGDEQAAIAEMQTLLEGAERNIQTRASEVEFALMLFQVGKPDKARALVEKVLSEDAAQVGALKFKASWLIDEDNTGDAIVLLREALGQAPRDPQLMTLMAQAHERNGDRELMGEMLALATEMSGNAPDETLRYARFLIAEGDLEITERILTHALRQTPEHPELLFLLGDVFLNLQDWDRLDTVLLALRDLDSPETRRVANELQAHMLAAQQRTDELTSFLNELANDPEFGLPADIALIRLMLTKGQTAEAFAHLDQLLLEDPDSLPIRLIKAHALIGEDKRGEAEQLYRAILEDYPNTTRAWLALHGLATERNAPDQAREILTDALASLPESPALLMLQAADYEHTGDLDQAIATYEKLYPITNRSLVVANNLASLLTTHRSDDDSLRRAQALAQRLRGTQEPVFQETYGWVAYRVGNYEEAAAYLEPAAAAFPEHPLVLYHLGKTYAALERNEDALRLFHKARAFSGDSTEIASLVDAEIEQLNAAPASGN